MPDIVVAKPFTLTLDKDRVVSFTPGIHKDVDAEVADHWFTKAHLAKDGKMPEPEQTTPLTHEERIAAKASIDAAEKRAVDAETEAKAARDAHDGLKAGMEKLTADNASLRSRVASLEADLDKATKPPATTTSKPSGTK